MTASASWKSWGQCTDARRLRGRPRVETDIQGSRNLHHGVESRLREAGLRVHFPVGVHRRTPGSAASLKPNARATFNTVAKLGLPSALSGRQRRSRLSPAFLATIGMPLARAMSPRARAMPAASSGASSSHASRYAAISAGVRRCSATSYVDVFGSDAFLAGLRVGAGVDSVSNLAVQPDGQRDAVCLRRPVATGEQHQQSVAAPCVAAVRHEGRQPIQTVGEFALARRVPRLRRRRRPQAQHPAGQRSHGLIDVRPGHAGALRCATRPPLQAIPASRPSRPAPTSIASSGLPSMAGMAPIPQRLAVAKLGSKAGGCVFLCRTEWRSRRRSPVLHAGPRAVRPAATLASRKRLENLQSAPSLAMRVGGFMTLLLEPVAEKPIAARLEQECTDQTACENAEPGRHSRDSKVAAATRLRSQVG